MDLGEHWDLYEIGSGTGLGSMGMVGSCSDSRQWFSLGSITTDHTAMRAQVRNILMTWYLVFSFPVSNINHSILFQYIPSIELSHQRIYSCKMLRIYDILGKL